MQTRRWVYWLDKSKPCLEGRPNAHPVSIVVENESGHYPTGQGDLQMPWYWDDTTCETKNRELGFSPGEVFNIVESSIIANLI